MTAGQFVAGSAVWHDPATNVSLVITSDDADAPDDQELLDIAEHLVTHPYLALIEVTDPDGRRRSFTVSRSGPFDQATAERFLTELQAGGQTQPVTPGS